MRTFSMKKKLVAAGIVVGSVASAFGAYAYWSGTGTGSGTGSVANTTNGVVLTAATSSAIVPGGTSTVTVKATNAGPSSVAVSSFRATSITVTGTCSADDFSMADVTLPAPVVVPAGTTTPMTIGTGTLAFADSATVSQDGCKGQTVTINLAAASS